MRCPTLVTDALERLTAMPNHRLIEMPPPLAEAMGPHHALAAHQVVLILGTDLTGGLSTHEARARLARFGPNELPPASVAGPLVRLARQVHHPLVYVLLAAGALTMALGNHVDAAVIFGVVFVNAVVGFVQESKAETALEALRSLVRTQARVRRDGRQRTIASTELVPGDVVLVEAGDKVPADLRLLEVGELQVDESALTGESVPVPKEEVVLPPTTPVTDRSNMVYSSTLVTHGRGTGVVVATGAETEVGEIHRLVGSADELATPLTRKLAGFSTLLTVAILGLAALTFTVGVARGESVADMVSAAVALAVGAIPEGLPAAMTITLAIGVSRMARRRAVVRRMPAVETLGSTTVICSDKTGTLTENQMTVQALWAAGRTYHVTGAGYRADGTVLDASGRPVVLADDQALAWAVTAAAACNDAHLSTGGEHLEVSGDPTETALLVLADKAGFDRGRWAVRHPRETTVPFSSERQYMVTLHQEGDHKLVLVKGGTERVLTLCGDHMGHDGATLPLDGAEVLREADALAAQGLRVLAMAMATVGAGWGADVENLTGALTLTGLVAMADPARPEAVAAVRACHTAGIEVKMITGDHPTTATAIADKIGIGPPGDGRHVLTGAKLAQLGPSEYPAAVEGASVFARVTPEQKLRIVQGLQARGHIVAMTGDGVNDAPALRQADIGVAMGKGGTEVAKDAADMVLTDDDFATIEAAVEEGRGVFDNLTKFIAWTLPTNVGEGLVVLVAILLGATLPLMPVQILWVNMTTAVALGLMLAFEPKEADIMLRRPRNPRQPLLTRPLALRVIVMSAVLVGGAMWLFQWEQAGGAPVNEARTSALNFFVATEAFYLVACRSSTRSVWQIGLLSNPWALGGILVQAVAQVAITYFPAMNTLFGTAPIGAGAWLRLLLLAAGGSMVVAADKWARRVAAARHTRPAT